MAGSTRMREALRAPPAYLRVRGSDPTGRELELPPCSGPLGPLRIRLHLRLMVITA
jgi:hypothetical protein